MSTAGNGNHFFIIGAQRSGTTSLYQALDAHHDIIMARPVQPEPKHFLVEGSDQPAALATYESKFFSDTSARWCGEKSTTYIERPDVAERIAVAYPSARIVVSLRAPLARAMSNHAFSTANGFETRPLVDGLTAPPDMQAADGNVGSALSNVSTSPFNYLGRSRYEQHLPVWLDRFDERVCVLVFEELRDGPARTQLESFLDLEPDSLPDFPHANRSEAVRDDDLVLPNSLRQGFANTTRWVENLLGRPIPAWHAHPAK